MITDLRSMKEETRDVLSLFFLALLCYYDKILLGPYAVVDFYDTLEVHFSHFKTMAQLWSTYGAFSWYPFHAGGVPSFVGQHPPYHPAVFLTGILPIWLVALVWSIAQMFLAGYGMYHFLRLLPRISRNVSLIVASLTSLIWISGNVHMVMPSAFPAFFVWTVSLFRSDTTRAHRVWCALLILIVSLFSFPVLTLPHFPILHLALVLFMGRHLPDFRRQVLGVFIVWTGYVLLFIPSIVSLFMYIPFAQRDWNFTYPGLWPALYDLARWFVGRLADQPMLGLVFFGLPLLAKRAISQYYILFATVLLVSGAFSSDLKGMFAGSFLLKMDLFMFATTQGIIAAVIAALTIETYVSEQRKYSWLWIVLICVALSFFGSSHKVIGYIVLLGSGCAAIIILRRAQDGLSSRNLAIAVAVFVFCLAGSAMIIRQQFMTTGMFVPYAKGYMGHPALELLAEKAKQKPFRVACIDVHPGVIQSYGLDTVGEKSPLFNKYYKEYVREIVRSQLPTEKDVVQFDELWRQLYLTRNQIDHDQRSITLSASAPRNASNFNWPLLLAMNVTHVISLTPVEGMETVSSKVTLSPGMDVEAPWLKYIGLGHLHSLPLIIYELNRPQGLSYLAWPNVLNSDQQVLNALGNASPEEMTRNVYINRSDLTQQNASKSPSLGVDRAKYPGTVRVAYWSPDRIVLEGEASDPCVLTLSNNFDPKWQATLDSKVNLQVFRANHAFQGVNIDRAGAFTIELRYSQALIWWLHTTSLLGVLLILSGICLRQTSFGSTRVLPEIRCSEVPWSWKWSLAIGALASLLWALGFALFVLGKHKGPQTESFPYALATIPVVGVLVSLWAKRLIRKL